MSLALAAGVALGVLFSNLFSPLAAPAAPTTVAQPETTVDVAAPPPAAASLLDFVALGGAVAPSTAPSLLDALLASLPAAGATAAAPSHPSAPHNALLEGVLASGETLAAALARHGVAASTVAVIVRELRPHFDFRRARPGHHWRLQTGDEGQLISFRYELSKGEHYELRAAGGKSWSTAKAKEGVLRQQARLAGVVSTTLHDAVANLGERPQLAADLTAIFAWDFDFAKSVRPGDEFRILYERNYQRRPEGGGLRYLGPGRVLAAHYKSAGGQELDAIYYETAPGQGGYYRPNGKSVKQTFLAAPVNYQKITSEFTPARFHPILKVTRPHPGIDYAAPAGTPVWAVANGRVSYAGWMGGYGRLVKIEHAGGYESYYAHLSTYANGLRVGDVVRQKQVIGSVGSSGLSTGPHVCFRITKDGDYVNPLTVQMPAGDSVPSRQRQDFETVRDARIAQLRPGPIAATDEAM